MSDDVRKLRKYSQGNNDVLLAQLCYNINSSRNVITTWPIGSRTEKIKYLETLSPLPKGDM